MRTPTRSIHVQRRRAVPADQVTDAPDPAPDNDRVIVEEPLQIRLAGDPLAITMRTPGHDRELVLGFLWAEGAITALADITSIEHCGSADTDDFENCIDVTPSAHLRLTHAANIGLRRGTMTTSACGVCGRRTIDDLLARCAAVSAVPSMSMQALIHAAARLTANQPHFGATGGCHGAALVDTQGEVIAAYEDVGRHNAVDKVIGARLLAGAMPIDATGASGAALIVSGRTSFEIVQKAVTAGIGIVAGISAASSLAIDTAERTGVTLVGFVRDTALVVYTHPKRIVSS